MADLAEEFDPALHTHRRYNPLTDEYIVVSPGRARRPWLGQVEPPQPPSLPQHDPACYLCPGNHRAGGIPNPSYSNTYTFPNDFAALAPDLPLPSPKADHPLLTVYPVQGRCDVLCFHPRHDLTLARLAPADISRVIEEWTRIYKERSLDDGIKYVQIFENKGAMMGCSNPHPHGQIWSMTEIPSIPTKELIAFKRYGNSHTDDSNKISDRTCLLCDYARLERGSVRVVLKNSHWITVVPWWATWPFEILLMPYGRHVISLADLTSDEKLSLAEILSAITIRYDNLFSCSFAYSMGIHQAPISLAAARAKGLPEEDCNLAHLHLHFLPPLLRSASVRKFLVGFELMAEAQRDLTPEQAADRLRKCSSQHYADGV